MIVVTGGMMVVCDAPNRCVVKTLGAAICGKTIVQLLSNREGLEVLHNGVQVPTPCNSISSKCARSKSVAACHQKWYVELLLVLLQVHLRQNMLLVVLAEMVHGVLAQCCRGNSR